MTIHNLKYMKKIFLSILIFLVCSTSLLSHVEHYKNFNKLEYDLYRNNKLIGNHTFNFNRKSGILEVKSLVEFKITKLGVDLYKYRAESTESYENNIFSKFSSTTNQNNKQKCSPKCTEKWNLYYNLNFSDTEWKTIFCLPYTITCDTKLREFQFKIVQQIAM